MHYYGDEHVRRPVLSDESQTPKEYKLYLPKGDKSWSNIMEILSVE